MPPSTPSDKSVGSKQLKKRKRERRKKRKSDPSSSSSSSSGSERDDVQAQPPIPSPARESRLQPAGVLQQLAEIRAKLQPDDFCTGVRATLASAATLIVQANPHVH